jgi:hypothetical protein
VLLVCSPEERNGFAVRRLREVSKGVGDVGVVGNETAALHEHAEGRAEFVEVGGGDHATDGIQVFVSEADANGAHLKAKKDAAGVAEVLVAFNCQFCSLQRVR